MHDHLFLKAFVVGEEHSHQTCVWETGEDYLSLR